MYESLTRLDNMYLFVRFVISLLYHKNSTISEYDDLIGYAGKYTNHSVAWYNYIYMYSGIIIIHGVNVHG